MPEYLSPGVYVIEVSAHAKQIAGVSTSTTEFLGAQLIGRLREVVQQLPPGWTDQSDNALLMPAIGRVALVAINRV